MADLNPKQKVFCEEYLIDLNATQAAIRAGYSKKTAQAIAAQNLSKLIIQNYIQALMDKRSDRTQVKVDDVVRELQLMAFSRLDGFLEWGSQGVVMKQSKDLTDDQIACVAEVQESTTNTSRNVKFKLCDKLKSLELLGKHLGMLVERHEHTGKDGEPIKHELFREVVRIMDKVDREKNGRNNSTNRIAKYRNN